MRVVKRLACGKTWSILFFQCNSKHAKLTVPPAQLCLGPLVLFTGLIEATLLVLQHSLEWSLLALQLLHAVQPYIKPVHQQLVIRLHGIKPISAFLRPSLRPSLQRRSMQVMLTLCLLIIKRLPDISARML